jgi:hypothetical protein
MPICSRLVQSTALWHVLTLVQSHFVQQRCISSGVEIRAENQAVLEPQCHCPRDVSIRTWGWQKAVCCALSRKAHAYLVHNGGISDQRTFWRRCDIGSGQRILYFPVVISKHVLRELNSHEVKA